MANDVVTPIVHLNGTGREELLRVREEFYRALTAAERTLCAMAPNGRDYYVEPGRWEKALAQHERRRAALAGLRREIEAEVARIDG